MSLALETQLTYTIPLLRRAVLAYWKRSVGIVLPVAWLVVAAALVFLVGQGNRSWVIGVLATIVTITLFFMVALYFVHYRNAMQKLRDMGPPKARFLAEEKAFTVESDIGIATFQWCSIKEIWTFPTFWLMLFSKAQFMTVPLASLDPDMRSFVMDRVRQAGGTIS